MVPKSQHHRFLMPANRVLRSHTNKTMLPRVDSAVKSSNLQPALSISIHIAFLGLMLSSIHLIIVCTGLLRVPVSSSPVSSSTLWQLICLLVSSVAMDTLLCVRLHLVSCFLCLVLLNLAFESAPTFGGSEGGGGGNRGEQITDGGSEQGRMRQQRFACLALSHSLPWALAAGSALFITLRPVEEQGEGEKGGFAENGTVESATSIQCCSLNLFFTGLRTILPCDSDASTATVSISVC